MFPSTLQNQPNGRRHFFKWLRVHKVLVGVLMLSAAAWGVLYITIAPQIESASDFALGPICRAIEEGIRDIDVLGFVALLSMWILMGVAMMLPTALPLIRTYIEINLTASEKNVQTVSVWVLIAGYLIIWMGFGVAATVIQIGFLTFITPYFPPQILLGSALILAGAYQFSSLKASCLKACQNPFTTLFGKWSDRSRKVFALGIEQGIFCLGCCWALMLVMIFAGMTNMLFMFMLMVVMTAEKAATSLLLTKIIGYLFIIIGIFAVIFTIWPL